MFSEIILFNDDAPRNITAFTCNCAGKTVAGKLRRRDIETMREKGERVRDSVLQRKGLASVINLTTRQISRGLEMDSPLVLELASSRWQLRLSKYVDVSILINLSAATFHPSCNLWLYHTNHYILLFFYATYYVISKNQGGQILTTYFNPSLIFENKVFKYLLYLGAPQVRLPQSLD